MQKWRPCTSCALQFLAFLFASIIYFLFIFTHSRNRNRNRTRLLRNALTHSHGGLHLIETKTKSNLRRKFKVGAQGLITGILLLSDSPGAGATPPSREADATIPEELPFFAQLILIAASCGSQLNRFRIGIRMRMRV